MIRLVLDTNIIVSALLQPLGPLAQISCWFSAVQFDFVSGNVYAEYEEVIHRPRLRLDENVIATALHTIREKSVWVRPTGAIRACADPDDDIFLECAQAARATYLGDWEYQALSLFMAQDSDRLPQHLRLDALDRIGKCPVRRPCD